MTELEGGSSMSDLWGYGLQVHLEASARDVGAGTCIARDQA